MTIQVFDTQGQSRAVSSKDLTFRPAVYGIFIEHDQILLLRNRETQLLSPLGGIVQENEAPTQAIRHYFRTLTGIIPVLGSLLFIENQYRQEDDVFFQLSALYYMVERPFTASMRFPEDDTHPIQPDWFQLDSLDRSQFQFGYEAVQAGKLHVQL